jgi:hypothetical protein
MVRRADPSGTRSLPMGHHRPADVVVVVGALLLLGALGISLPAGRGGLPGPASGRGPVAAGGSLCTTLTTNATLQGWAKDYYSNSTISPSESVAVAEVAQDWGTVCTSSAFQTAYAQPTAPAFGARVYEGDQNWSPAHVLSSSVFVEFTLSWNESCPSGPGYPSGYACNFRDSWTGNLTTNSLVGPVDLALSTRLAACTFGLTNSSIVFAVDAFYPNASLHPDRSAAEQAARTVWGEVCTSLPFYTNYTAHGDPPVSLGESAASPPGESASNGSSGASASGYLHLELTFDFAWEGPCPTGTSFAANSNCSFDAEWSANLSNGTWRGPGISTEEIQTGWPGGVPPFENPPVAENNATNPVYLGAVLGAAVVLFGSLLLLEAGRPPRRPPPTTPVGPPR